MEPDRQFPPLLELRDTHAYYGKACALSGVSISVNQGEVVSIVGPNGAGKTTTLRVMSGILLPSSGSIYIDGELQRRPSAHAFVKAGIAHSPEGRLVFPYMSVDDNLRTGAHTVRDAEVVQTRLMSVYDMFPVLREKRSVNARNLSGGQQQMLAIGRAIMSGPRLLLLDEPTLGLAPKIIREIGDIIVRLRGSTTIVLVEQNADLALKLADRVYVIAHGRIVAQGTPESLRGSQALKEAYLGTS